MSLKFLDSLFVPVLVLATAPTKETHLLEKEDFAIVLIVLILLNYCFFHVLASLLFIGELFGYTRSSPVQILDQCVIKLECLIFGKKGRYHAKEKSLQTSNDTESDIKRVHSPCVFSCHARLPVSHDYVWVVVDTS